MATIQLIFASSHRIKIMAALPIVAFTPSSLNGHLHKCRNSLSRNARTDVLSLTCVTDFAMAVFLVVTGERNTETTSLAELKYLLYFLRERARTTPLQMET